MLSMLCLLQVRGQVGYHMLTIQGEHHDWLRWQQSCPSCTSAVLCCTASQLDSASLHACMVVTPDCWRTEQPSSTWQQLKAELCAGNNYSTFSHLNIETANQFAIVTGGGRVNSFLSNNITPRGTPYPGTSQPQSTCTPDLPAELQAASGRMQDILA